MPAVVRALAVFLLVASWGPTLAAGTPVQNGFVLEPSDVPVAEILSGGPPRDGIPALDHPYYAAAHFILGKLYAYTQQLELARKHLTRAGLEPAYAQEAKKWLARVKGSCRVSRYTSTFRR